MSLRCYWEKFDDPPEGVEIVRDNEFYFNEYTVDKLDKHVDRLLKHVDGATYHSERYFTDRFGGNLYWSDLSTGGKTVLNVFYNPNVCFWCGECGANAYASINTYIREGIVLDCRPIYFIDELDNMEIDVVDTDGHFTSINDYVEATEFDIDDLTYREGRY